MKSKVKRSRRSTPLDLYIGKLFGKKDPSTMAEFAQEYPNCHQDQVLASKRAFASKRYENLSEEEKGKYIDLANKQDAGKGGHLWEAEKTTQDVFDIRIPGLWDTILAFNDSVSEYSGLVVHTFAHGLMPNGKLGVER
jgi:hypothetical protein